MLSYYTTNTAEQYVLLSMIKYLNSKAYSSERNNYKIGKPNLSEYAKNQ